MINILIVDDVDANLYSLEALLKQLEFDKEFTAINIIKASNGEDALKIAMQQNINLILLDVQMPEMNGFEVAQFLKSTQNTKDIPIIFVTAIFKKDEFIKQGFSIGAIDYFTKPIEKYQFLNRIKLYLSLFQKQEKLDNLNKSLEQAVEIRTQELKIQTQKAQSLAKSKSEFLANMSHEIRTPLNAIVGFVDIIRDETKEDKTLEYANIIDDASKSLLKIIEDILDFSKIESGKLNIDKIDFDTQRELGIISHLFQAKCSKKNITLKVIFDKNIPKVINTDPLRIKQIIANLISNAIKFTKPHKNIFVNFDYEDNSLKVSVKDEGKGIAKDKLSHIFDAFSQEDTSTTREFGGTGLGLSIGSELTKLLGGELKLKSELGVGSEFYFSIPATIGKDIIEQKTNLKDINFDNKKILLAEDNKANQMYMKVVFKKMKLKFDIASDGVETVDMFKKGKYDVVLMDENMPNLNGIGATKEILEYEKENNLSHTPIIALTANALKGDRERFLAAGMDEYLTKPVDKKKLSEILGQFLV